MYRKMACIFISVFLNRVGYIVQALILLILLVFFMQINNLRRPFINRSLNDIENMSLMTTVVTIYCGLFYISSKDPTSESYVPNRDFYLTETSKLVIFLVILFANILFIVMWFLRFISIVRYMLKEKYLKIYVCIFLCCRNDKL
jgi:hypothetical protein